MSKCFLKPVDFENIFYLPPNTILLKNFSILNDETAEPKKLLKIPASFIHFSIPDIIQKKNLRILSANAVGAITNTDDIINFIKNNFARIFDLLASMPKDDFKFTLSTKIKENLSIELKNGIILAHGEGGKNKFSLKGFLLNKSLNVENFELIANGISCQLWGKINPQAAEFKGFVFLPVFKIHVLDIDSRIKFNLPQIELERFNCSVNNNPVKLTANILLNKPFTSNLKLFSDFRSMEARNDARIKKVELTASFISQTDKSIKVNADLNIDFLEHKKEYLPLEKLKINAKDLLLSLRDSSSLEISSPFINLFSKTSANTYDINFEDLDGRIYQLGNTIMPGRFSSRFYGGRMHAKMFLEMREFFPIIRSDILIKDADADKLKNVLIHFSKTAGKLSSRIYFSNHPELILKGIAHIHNGYLNEFDFLKWLARLFNLPDLRKIDFDTASTEFIADKSGVGMNKMKLDSKNIKISGDFKLKEADMVESTVSFSFRRSLLEKSSKFKRLLGLLNTKQEQVKFNFRLSGNLHKMNFLWLQSDFKDELERSIPDFAKRGLEKALEEIIESIAED